MSIADVAARKGSRIGITKTGKWVSYIRLGDPVEDLDAGTSIAPETSHKLKGVFTKVDFRLVDGTKIKHTDRMILFDAVSFEAAIGADEIPSSDDRVQVGTRDLAILGVLSVMSGEQYALHKVAVSR